MQRLVLILGLTFGVMLNAHAQSILAASAPHHERWGESQNNYQKQGFKPDYSQSILRLEDSAFHKRTTLSATKKINVLSKKANVPHIKGIQTALFFENQLARFKHTMVFSEAGLPQIKREIKALEQLLADPHSVMTKAVLLRKSGSWRYTSSSGVYKVSILFDEEDAGSGIFRVEGAWRDILSTLKQYERHLLVSSNTL